MAAWLMNLDFAASGSVAGAGGNYTMIHHHYHAHAILGVVLGDWYVRLFHS